MTTATRYSWTQPVCVACWDERHPDTPADRTADDGEGPPEECCACARATRSGLYIRVDPSTVSHPTNRKR